MHLHKMKQWFLGLCCLLLLGVPDVVAKENTVRVAFIPQLTGFYYIEENGGYAGYNYEYLMEISEYTDWDIEFVLIDEGIYSYDKAKAMLLSDELDLVGPMFLSDEDAPIFLYSENHNGLSRHTLCTSFSSSITADNYIFQECLTAALVIDHQEANDAFFHLMARYDTPHQVTYVENQEQALELLVNRQVDTVMSMDVYSSYGILEELDTANPTPFHFITTQDKGDLLETLDMAAEKLDIAEPGLNKRLVSTYFSDEYEGTITLSAAEEIALQDYPYLNVGLLKNLEPYQFYVEGSDKLQGISVEVLDMISQIIDVEFRYIWADGYEELTEMLENGSIDICASLPFDYDLSSRFGVVLTRPYITSGALWLHQFDEMDEVDYYYHFVSDNIPQIHDDDLIRVENIEQTIANLSETGDITLICDPYIAQYHLQKLAIINVEMQNLSNVHSQITLGVGKHVDVAIIGLLNRAILHLDPFDVDEIIYRNVTNTGAVSFSAFVQQNVSVVIQTITVCFLLIVFYLSSHARKLRILSEQDGLTKLYNSGYFHHYAEEKSIKIPTGTLILFDIDYFKQVNDTHGHQVGDKVIVSVAQNVKKLFQQHGVVARLGGDEFVVLLEGEQDDLEEKCRTLLDIMETAVEQVPVSLSIGGIRFHEPTEYKELYRLADECLYQVKENGKHNFHFGNK